MAIDEIITKLLDNATRLEHKAMAIRRYAANINVPAPFDSNPDAYARIVNNNSGISRSTIDAALRKSNKFTYLHAKEIIKHYASKGDELSQSIIALAEKEGDERDVYSQFTLCARKMLTRRLAEPEYELFKSSARSQLEAPPARHEAAKGTRRKIALGPRMGMYRGDVAAREQSEKVYIPSTLSVG